MMLLPNFRNLKGQVRSTIFAALCFTPLALLAWSLPISAQSITPAMDGTGTIVNTNGGQFNITGGTQTGGNLFHSFQRLGLNQGEAANFLANPNVQNILGRVVGGDPSVINGLIQVTGSNANLYLMNPAGIVFGANASLNVPASFTATTATGIQFGNVGFNAIGSNDYATLVGAPTGFAFATSQPGAIVNAANLSVSTGNSLTLLGGTVVNTGQLNAPEGQITVMAVPGSRLVRLSQPGSLLSLEIEPLNQPSTLTPPSLPQLLTGSGTDSATGVMVNEQGQVVLTSGAIIPSQPGSAIVSGTLNTSGQTGGTVQVLGAHVALSSATVSANGVGNGGTVLIGGDYQGRGTVPNAQRSFVSRDSTISVDSVQSGNGGRAIVWADDTTAFYGSVRARGGTQAGNGGFAEVSGKQHLMFDGTADLSAANGQFGTLLLDPTDVLISDGSDPGTTMTEAALESMIGNVIIDATNNITIGTLSNNELNFSPGAVSVEFAADSDLNGSGTFQMGTTQTLVVGSRNISISGAEINLGNINARGGAGAGGSVTLTTTGRNISAGTTGDISTGWIATTADTGGTPNLNPSGNITVTSGGALVIGGAITAGSNQGATGEIKLTARGNITANQIDNQPTNFQGTSGSIKLLSYEGDIDVSGSGVNPISNTLESGIFSGGAGSSSGTIRLEAPRGKTTTGRIRSSASGGGSNIELIAGGDITTGALNADYSGTAQGSGGNITVKSGGAFTLTGNISTFVQNNGGNGGNVDISARNDVTFNCNNPCIESFAGDNNSGGSQISGYIQINSDQGRVSILGSNSSSIGSYSNSTTGRAGRLSITAQGDIVTSVILAGDSTPQGGEIYLQSRQGSINTASGGSEFGNSNAGLLETGNSNGNSPPTNPSGGRITLDAYGDVVTGNIDATGLVQGGTVTLTSRTGNVNTSAGLVGAFSPNGNGGNIQVDANQRIIAGDINTRGLTGSGVVDLQGSDILFTGSELTLGSTQGSPGELILNTLGTVQLPATISANGANIRSTSPLTSLSGLTTGSSINTGGGNLSLGFTSDFTLDSSVSITTNSGDVTLTSPGNLTINGTINTSSATADGGNIILTAPSGLNITTPLNTSAPSGQGGRIALTSNNGAITSSDLTTTGNSGGRVDIIAQTEITSGRINTSASNGNGGNVLIDPIGNVEVGWINTQGGPNGRGGSVDITTGRFFIASETFTALNGLNASISTIGGRGGGNITIRHDGGARATFFNITNLINNGAAGAFTTGTETITFGSYPGTYIQGNIRILTTDYPAQPFEKLTPEKLKFEDKGTLFPLEELFTRQFEPQEQAGETKVLTLEEMQSTLKKVEDGTGTKPALIYVSFTPVATGTPNNCEPGSEIPDPEKPEQKKICQCLPVQLPEKQDDWEKTVIDYSKMPSKCDRLTVTLVTSKGKPFYKPLPDAPRYLVEQIAGVFRKSVEDSSRPRTYKEPGKKLYEWFIKPLQTELQERNVQNLSFLMPATLRLIPFAALVNEDEKFLIQTYSAGLMPSLSLVDTRPVQIRNVQMLAMGVSEFSDPGQISLPQAEEEVKKLVPNVWSGRILLNEDVTFNNLAAQRRNGEAPFGILHFATHGAFPPNSPENLYIQLSDRKLHPADIRSFNWINPPIELLVLSACETAYGDEKAELGFAGSAARLNVKSVIGTLWYIADNSLTTSALMEGFYQRLKVDKTIKADALARAQQAFVEPPYHPYDWAAFTLIGNPW